MPRLGGVRPFSVRLDAGSALQVRGQAEHEAGPNDGMQRELLGQSFQERVALSRVDRRCSGLDGVVLVVG